MRIARLEAVPFRIPLRHPVRWATGRADVADHVLVRVHTDEGLTGVAEAIPRPSIYGESQVGIVHALREWFAPMLVGENPFAVERVWARLGEVAFNHTAKAAIDLTLHDIAAQRAGVPLCEYLGGWTDRVPVTWMVHLKSPGAVAEEVAARAAEGFRSFKLKGGVDPDADVETVRRVRARVGDRPLVYVDANQGYRLEVALRVMREFAALNVAFVEEPLPVGQMPARVHLGRAGALPVLGDDSCFTPADVARELAAGAVRLVSVKPARTGVFLSRKVLALAEAAGAACLIGTQGESMLGTLASAHLGAGARFAYPGEHGLFTLLADDILAEPLRFEDGALVLPRRPGIGAVIDEEKLAHYRLDR